MYKRQTLIFSLPLGLLLAKGRMSRHKWIRRPVSAYLLVMRGTPLILQLIFFYFAPYYLFKLSYDRFAAAILTFTLNYAAYFAEIYRGGIESIPQGQYEAAHVLGFSKGQTFFQIILPQVVKRILPCLLYTSWHCHEQVAADYALTPVRPVLDGEPRYEDHPACFNPEFGYYYDAADRCV